MHIRTWHLVLIPVAWLCQTAQAIDCSSPTLKGASGVIGNKHDYKIAGQCSKTWKETKTGAGSSTTVNTAVTFNYLGSASWDRASGEAQEKLKFTGDSAGTHYASAICTQDPFLKDPPGGAASCGTITVQVKVDAGEIYKPLLDKVFWASKRLSLAEAQALSAQAAASKPPPPPPAAKAEDSKASMPAYSQSAGIPAKSASPSSGPVAAASARVDPAGTAGSVAVRQPPQDAASRAVVIEQMEKGSAASRRAMPPQDAATRVATGNARATLPPAEAPRATQMEIEAESLVKSGAIQVAGGQARVQSMAGFGSGWSGDQQLFWSEGAPGAILDLVVQVPAASKYAVEIYMTRAPDYGKLRFEIDGKASDLTFDGMAPQVMPSGPTQLGTFALQAGTRRVSLMITGKYAQSGGYYVGIDKLRLYPAGPID